MGEVVRDDAGRDTNRDETDNDRYHPNGQGTSEEAGKCTAQCFRKPTVKVTVVI